MNDESHRVRAALDSLYELATQPIHDYSIGGHDGTGVCISIPLHVDIQGGDYAEGYSLVVKVYVNGDITSSEMTLSRGNYDILTLISNKEGVEYPEWIHRVITHYPMDMSWRTVGGAYKYLGWDVPVDTLYKVRGVLMGEVNKMNISNVAVRV